ncbi:Protein tincar [Melipona quadrifasciata]|uniref:Protein tincar n=1 Tax=Melipona quadrifasciata TaxID=166423 RepID=A0A0M8ZUY3_9HYME|nr:Protein tincar [Melipona quadrifasciata]
MSMTGSLMGYENNNEVNQAKCKKPLKPLPIVSSINSSGITTTNKTKKPRRSARRNSCIRGHVNSLWSVWYGVLAVAFQAYIGLRYTKRFAAYLSLPWPADAPPPKVELYACLVLAGAGVVLLPVLLGAAFLKLGNLANDGIKLGRHLSACSRDPPSSLLTNNPDHSLANNLWRHGGPTAAFVHLCTAMCFLLPSLLMEARLIHAGFLPKETIWRTDLDWLVTHRDRLVVSSFMNPNVNLSILTGFITPQPYVTLTPDEEPDDIASDIVTTRLELTDVINKSTEFKPYNDTSNKQNLGQFRYPSTSASLPRIFNSGTTLPTERILPTATTHDITNNATITTPSNVVDGSSDSTKVTSTATPTKSTEAARVTVTAASASVPTATFTSTLSSTSGSMKYGNTARRLVAAKSIVRNNNAKGKLKAKNVGRSPTTVRPGKGVPAGNMTAQSMLLTMNSLADLDHPEKLNLEFQAAESYGPITLEYLNYAIALGVYSVRYPAVFWSCNKPLATIFSFQLIINSAQSLLAYVGMSVLYKVQVIGPLKVLPVLRQQYRTISTTSSISTIFGDSYFLLNPHVTLILFALSSLLVLCSSMVMYFYAYGSAPLLYDYIVVYRGSLDGAVLACVVATVLHLFLWLFMWIFLTIKQRWTFKLRVTIGRATVRSARSVKLVTDVDLLSARDDDDGTNAPLLVVGNGRTYTIADASPKKAIMSVIQKAAIERKARNQGNADSVNGDSAADDEQIYWLRPKLRPSPTRSPSDANGAPTSEKGWLNKKLKPKVTFNDLPSTSGSRNKGKVRRGTGDGGPEDDGDYATLRELPLITSLDPADDSTSEENKWERWLISRRDVIPKFGNLLECVNDDQVTYYASANRDLQPSEGDPSPLLTPDPLPDPTSEPLPLPPPTPTPTPTCAPTTEVITALLTTNTQVLTTKLLCRFTVLPMTRRAGKLFHVESNPPGIFAKLNSHPALEKSIRERASTSCWNTVLIGSLEPLCVSENSTANGGQTPRCLRRGDSGMPHEELTPRSDSSNSPPLDAAAGGSSGAGSVTGHSNASSHSETSSSGVHSNASNASNSSCQRRATSVDDVSGNCDQRDGEEPVRDQWRSCSLQRGVQPPSATAAFSPPNSRPGTSQSFSSPQYANHVPLVNASNDVTAVTGQGCPAVILENPNEATVVIRRKLSRTKLTDPLNPTEEPFGRSTNMRMTSFTESNDIRVHASSATLPHYPTQPVVTYPHCSTMPLPHASHSMAGSHMGGSSGSCGSVPRHAFVPPQVHSTVPAHTTLPSHHNGVRLLHGIAAAPNNPFVKRFPPVPWALPGHHTFPQASQVNGKLTTTAQIRQSDRDSANFSMASSGDSDTCLPH